MAKKLVDVDRIKQVLNYDPQTGVFVWTARTGNRVAVGAEAGTVTLHGRVQIRIDGVTHYAHRLAWAYMTGESPRGPIDHIDGNPMNNAFANLRDVDDFINAQNRTKPDKRSKSGLIGAAWNDLNKNWRARIYTKGRTVELGSFDTAEEAHAAYVSAKRKLHDGCTF